MRLLDVLASVFPDSLQCHRETAHDSPGPVRCNMHPLSDQPLASTADDYSPALFLSDVTQGQALARW